MAFLTNRYVCGAAIACQMFMTTAHAQDDNALERCQKLFDSLVTPYQELYRQLPPPLAKLATNHPVTKLTSMTSNDCLLDATTTYEKIRTAVSAHSRSFAVITKSAKDEETVQGLQSAGQQYGLKLWPTTEAMEKLPLLTRLGIAVYVQEVTAIVTRGNKEDIDILSRWANRLKIPLFIMQSPPPSSALTGRYTYYVFPDLGAMAHALGRYVQQRGWHNIATLRPAQGAAATLSQQLDNLLKTAGIQNNQQYVYLNQDFASMDDAVRKLLQIDKNARQEEYAKLYEDAKKKAEADKVTFQPQQIMLPPITDFDAIFIPDNFKIVRHFVKLLKFYGVKSVPLIGHQGWRAPELIQPSENFFRDAVFVDFLGSLTRLPDKIVGNSLPKSGFLPPESSQAVDWKMIGWRTGEILQSLLTQTTQDRYLLFEATNNLDVAGTAMFSAGRAFTAQHTAVWPAFLFRVTDKSIIPL